ncbi:unnamed protein product [Chrysodeixis includens]|uniref:Uncharacterized protein n=1 Tax=Chrysodeixis includens TaxID=689277 RepID=A0A9N8KY41_CHRIL|nr:unnamed protein product [Chrysodeixis includens]
MTGQHQAVDSLNFRADCSNEFVPGGGTFKAVEPFFQRCFSQFIPLFSKRVITTLGLNLILPNVQQYSKSKSNQKSFIQIRLQCSTFRTSKLGHYRQHPIAHPSSMGLRLLSRLRTSRVAPVQAAWPLPGKSSGSP